MAKSAEAQESSALFLGDTEMGGLVRAFGQIPDCAWKARDGGYGSWVREILDPASGARGSDDRAWVFVLSPRVFDDPALESQIDALLSALEGAVGSRSVFFSTLFADPQASSALSSGWERAERAEKINARLREHRRKHTWFHILDLASFVQKHGYQTLYDPRYEAMARYLFHPGALATLAQWTLRHLNALDRTPAKVIALDMDNTLWGGVLGEDGPEGVKISTSGAGLHFHMFQKQLKQLKEEGFLLVGLSKNNQDEVEAFFKSHPDMVLKWDDFSARAVNWTPKHENLKRIAEELSLGHDSFLFIDDSAHERGEMSAHLPEVKIFDFPSDPSKLRSQLAECVHLDRLRTTDEDRKRARSYAEIAQRQEIKKQSASIEDYYRSLQTQVEVKRGSPESEERLHQLMLKTNQFNLASERPDPGVFRTRLSDPKRLIWSLRISDRVGDAGLTGLVDVDVSDASAWKVQNFLLSCRVLGRSVEFAALRWLGEKAARAGAKELRVRFIPSSRNNPAREFLEKAALLPADGDYVVLELDPGWEKRIPASYAAIVETKT
jgi:FkbH-like protein